LSFRNARSFEEEDEDGSLRQGSVVHEHDEAVNSADQVGHTTDPSQTAKAQFSVCGEVNHVQSLNSTTLHDFDTRTVHDLWQEYAYGVNGQEPLREKERRGTKWRQDPVNPKTGKKESALTNFWRKRRHIYRFIEMRIATGDSEAVAVETCQEIVNNYLPKSRCPNWRLLSPLLRGVLGQKKDAVRTCQTIFNKYLARNGRPISDIVGDQVRILNSAALPGLWKVYVHRPDTRAVQDLWQEYAYGLNGQEPLRDKERRGKEWRQDPIDPTKTGKRVHTLQNVWGRRRPIYLFIEMRIAMGDSEAVAVEICQEIVVNYITRNGSPNWKVVSPLLRDVVRQEERAVATCQKIFNKYLSRNGRPISGIIVQRSSAVVYGDFCQAQSFDKRTVHETWQEYAYGLNGQEPFRDKERRGREWRQDPIDPKTGKSRSTLRLFWSRRRPIYLFIEMRMAMGDSEVVAVETCQEIVDNYLTRNGSPTWNILCPLLNGVLRREETAVRACQLIFDAYLTRNGRPISGIVDPQSITTVAGIRKLEQELHM
jgi:hypothetical protein